MMRQTIFEKRKRQTPKMTFVFVLRRSLERLFYVTFSLSCTSRSETNKPPAMRVRVEGYTKKLQTRYNKGVQANCKAKGEKYGTKGT